MRTQMDVHIAALAAEGRRYRKADFDEDADECSHRYFGCRRTKAQEGGGRYAVYPYQSYQLTLQETSWEFFHLQYFARTTETVLESQPV
jgi:hypothetical protein